MCAKIFAYVEKLSYLCPKIGEMLFRYSFYTLIPALLVMAVLMVAIPLPQKDKRLRGYMFSRWMLALSYVALSLYCYFKGRMTLEMFSPIFLFMSNLQACLLALSHINLVHPQRVTTRSTLWHFLPMAVCLIIYTACRIPTMHVPLTTYEALYDNWWQPEVIARLLWMAQYVTICIYFVVQLVREGQRWRVLAGDFYADDRMISLRLIHASISVVLTIGATTLVIANNIHPQMAVVLNLLMLLLYIVLGILFLQYPGLFARMRPVLYETDDNQPVGTKRWDVLRRYILNHRLYTRPSVTLEQIARELGVSRTFLSNTINQHEGMNFNAFINRLRILEAQRMMRENGQNELSLQNVSDMVGYTDQSNFTRNFKHWSGKTPSEWRETNQTMDLSGE